MNNTDISAIRQRILHDQQRLERVSTVNRDLLHRLSSSGWANERTRPILLKHLEDLNRRTDAIWEQASSNIYRSHK